MRAVAIRTRESLETPEQLAEQAKIERMSIEEGAKRYRQFASKAVGYSDGGNLKASRRLMRHWFNVFVAVLTEDREQCRHGKAGPGRAEVAPILEVLDLEQIAVLTMHEAMGRCMIAPLGTRTVQLVYGIGRAVLAEINLENMRLTDSGLAKELHDRHKITPKRVNWWAGRNMEVNILSRTLAVQVGAYMFDLLQRSAVIGEYKNPDAVPAFQTEFRYYRTKSKSFTSLTDEAWKAIGDGHKRSAIVKPRHLPMIVTPRKWGEKPGGYLNNRVSFVAKPTQTQRRAYEKADLTAMYEGNYTLSRTPWRVNTRVLEVQRELWKSGGGEINFPSVNNIPYPDKPRGHNENVPRGTKWRDVSQEDRDLYIHACRRINLENRQLAMRRERLLQVHWIAGLFSEQPRLYFPHHIDFRGRCYPIPAHLEYQGEDHAKALLEFAEPVALDDSGKRELLIEAANCFGFGKLSTKDRVTWALDNFKQIVNAARRPLDNDWWHPRYDKIGTQVGGAEKPWQFLAACMAITDPEKGAHATTRADASCNGLQHYAALSRDKRAAKATNLMPSDEPQSVYEDVVWAVKPIVERDASGSDQVYEYRKWTPGGYVKRRVPFRDLARIFEGRINKATIKQPVMTCTYGVTNRGAAEQIYTKLRSYGVENEDLHAAARYLSRIVLQGIGEVLEPATKLMGWLKECAGAVAATGAAVGWTTELGFPVVQPYRLYRTCTVNTILQKFSVMEIEDDVPVDRRKQVQGCPPNFIHSLDQTHMHMTAGRCRYDKIEFAANHDAYITHAMTKRRMLRHAAHAFVDLHKRPILARMKANWEKWHPSVTLPCLPRQGTFDLNDVLDSEYLFS